MINEQNLHETEELKQMDMRLQIVNEELKHADHELMEIDKQKDVFISIAAHELKTPITTIMGFSQLLQDDILLSDIEKSKHYLNLINNNTTRLYSLIINLVDAFKITNKSIVLNETMTNIYTIFSNIRANTEHLIISKGITPEFYIQDGLPNISVDEEKLSRILENLMNNSIKFTNSGSISLHVYKDNDTITFYVWDTGIGIPKNNQEFIFSRFYQVNTSMARKEGGIGLGLFISKGLCDRMGGKIWFESVEGKGSTFYLQLPIKK